MSAGRRSPARRAALWLAVAVVSAWSLAPALWQVLTAFKPDEQITRTPTVYLPAPPTSAHLTTLFARKPFGRYVASSALVSSAATVLSVVVGALAAFALRQLTPRARRRALLGLLGVAVFPPILLLFPLYEGVRALGLVNHPGVLVVCYAALNLPLAVWVLDSGLAQVPPEIDEAARLDGLGPLGRLFRIQLPLVVPSLTAASLLVFIFCWNEFMLALTFMTADARKTLTAGIASVSGSSMFELPWGQLAAAVSVATVPLVVLVALFERHITEGLTRGAVKG